MQHLTISLRDLHYNIQEIPGQSSLLKLMYASSGLHEPCCALGPAIVCQTFSFFSNCHVVTFCMHKGIKRKFFNSREERNLIFTEMPPYLLKKKSFGLKIEMWNFGWIKGTPM